MMASVFQSISDTLCRIFPSPDVDRDKLEAFFSDTGIASTLWDDELWGKMFHDFETVLELAKSMMLGTTLLSTHASLTELSRVRSLSMDTFSAFVPFRKRILSMSIGEVVDMYRGFKPLEQHPGCSLCGTLVEFAVVPVARPLHSGLISGSINTNEPYAVANDKKPVLMLGVFIHLLSLVRNVHAC
jgi:hypothetical protein